MVKIRAKTLVLRFMGLALLGVGALLLSRPSWADPNATIDIQIDIQLMVQGRPVSATQTFELRFEDRNGFDHRQSRGKALIFEPAAGPPIFGLMAWSTEFDFPDIFTKCRPPSMDPDFIDWIKGFSGACDLPIDRLPMLVQFADPSNPKSIQILRPTTSPNPAPDEIQVVAARITRSATTFSESMRPPTPKDRLPWLSGLIGTPNTLIAHQLLIPHARLHTDIYSTMFYKEEFN